MEEKQILSININNIKDCIYVIRGQKVMLDFDLARIYGYETKNFNRQVKNNNEKFDNDFMFKLTKDEWTEILRCKNFTANSISKSRYLPHAFAEQGIYMLMTVLRGKLAIEQSKQLIKCFKLMKDYIAESGNLLTNTNSYIESRFANYDKRFKTIENKLGIVMDNFIDPSSYKLFLIMNGAKIEADLEFKNLKFQNGISNEQHGGVRKLPYAYTEHGIIALAGVLRSEVASKVSVEIARA